MAVLFFDFLLLSFLVIVWRERRRRKRCCGSRTTDWAADSREFHSFLYLSCVATSGKNKNTLFESTHTSTRTCSHLHLSPLPTIPPWHTRTNKRPSWKDCHCLETTCLKRLWIFRKQNRLEERARDFWVNMSTTTLSTTSPDCSRWQRRPLSQTLA